MERMCGEVLSKEVIVRSNCEEGMFTLNQFRVFWPYMVQYGRTSPTFLPEIALRRQEQMLGCDLLVRKAQSHPGIPDEAGQASDKPEGSM